MKLGIIGTGKIVGEALEALRLLPQIACTAVFARPHSREKAEALAAAYGIAEVYTDYEALLQQADVDFVYIGLVNSAHYTYAKQAIMAGRNVILEKPFTSTEAEAAELAALSRSHHVYLFEAVSFFFMPNFAALRDALPRIGRLRLVQCNYSQYSSRYDAYLEKQVAAAFSPEMSGGCLYDINIYNLNFVVGLFGMPQGVSYTANIGFNGIDTSGTAVLRYEDFIAVCTAAKDSASPGSIVLQGEKGYIRVNGAPNELAEFELCLAGGRVETMRLNQYEHRMVHEFEAIERLYAAGDWGANESGLQRSLQVMWTAERARRSAKISFSADAQAGRV